MNNELQSINHILKLEKDEKRHKLLLKESELLNQVILKLNQIKMLNEQLK
jgi:hypothetical protein